MRGQSACSTAAPMGPTTSAQSGLSPRPRGVRIAQAACIVGLLYAAVSVCWGLGGTWLLDTVGGSLERQGRAGDTTVMLTLWAAVLLKMIAAVLPLVAVRRLNGQA